MTLIFSQLRTFGTEEVVVTVNRDGTTLPNIELKRHDGSKEINSIKVEIIDNKPLYIPLGRSGQSCKVQFKTFNLPDYNAWYSVLGNDVLKVEQSDYTEFPVNTYWSVETLSIMELPGSAYAYMDVETEDIIDRGDQIVIMEYELEVSESLTTPSGVPRS